MSQGTLYVVATPIGNMEDVTVRALRILAEVGVVAAEDTRHTGRLLSRHGIRRPMISCRAENETRAAGAVLEKLEQGDVALVTDAGTPTLSDPGQRLVRMVSEAGFRVESLPGPSALVSALALSGVPAAQFTFVGFLPRKAGEMRRLLTRLGEEGRSFVFFESPYRLLKALTALEEVLPERQLVVCREMTKLHEEISRGPAAEILARYQGRAVRGEITVVVAEEDP